MNHRARITYRFDHAGERHAAGQAELETKPQEQMQGESLEAEQDIIETLPEPLFAGRSSASSSSPIVDMQPLNQFTTDFGAWHSSFDQETERIERLIRGTARSSAAQPEAEQGNTETHPTEGNSGELRAVQAPRTEYGMDDAEFPRFDSTETKGGYRHIPKTPWLRILLSIAGAVATGALFGVLVLGMLGDDGRQLVQPPGGGEAPAATVPTGKQEQPTVAAATDNPVSGNSTAGILSVAIPPKTYVLLQNGVFSSAQGAQTAQAELKQLGLAAASEAADRHYVFIGIAPSRDDALALSYKLQEYKLDVFNKSYALPEVRRIKWNSEPSSAAGNYFSEGSRLVQIVSSLTKLHLTEATSGALEELTVQTLKSTHQSWSGNIPAVAAGFPQEGRPAMEQMNRAMNTAIASLEEYRKHASASYLWQAQTAAIEYVLAEKQLLVAISVP